MKVQVGCLVAKRVDTGQTFNRESQTDLQLFVFSLLSPTLTRIVSQIKLFQLQFAFYTTRLWKKPSQDGHCCRCFAAWLFDIFPPSCSHILVFWHWIMLYLQGQELVQHTTISWSNKQHQMQHAQNLHQDSIFSDQDCINVLQSQWCHS